MSDARYLAEEAHAGRIDPLRLTGEAARQYAIMEVAKLKKQPHPLLVEALGALNKPKQQSAKYSLFNRVF